jgi:glycosyltransferase involved in cell wall biosynthesis
MIALRRSSKKRNHRRRVMQITWSLVAGGAEVYAFTIASNLNPDRYTSLICAIDQGGALEDEIKQRGIPYFVMNRRQGIELSLMWRLYKLFRKTGVNIIHTHHFNQLFYSALGAKLAGVRIIHTEHSVEVYRRRRLRIALRMLSLLCDKVTAVGSDGARLLRHQVGIPTRKLEVINAGVDVSDFTESKSEARRVLGLNDSDRVAIIIARLFPEKNHRLLLSAFADVVSRVERARLLIAGAGVEEATIREQIEQLKLGDSVQMLGVRRDVARLLAASDVFVLASDREGLPVALLEAMAAGKPVVATAVGDIPSILKDGVNGRLVRPRNRQALAEALMEVLSDSERASAMGQNARRMIAETFSLRSMITKYEALYTAGSQATKTCDHG